jgi:hypothetical protein
LLATGVRFKTGVMGKRLGWAVLGLAGGVVSGCALDVQGTASLDGGELGGDDAGTIAPPLPDAGMPPPPMEGSADPPDAGTAVDADGASLVEGQGCPDGTEVRDIDPPLPNNTGNFATTGPVCARYLGDVTGWGVSNGQGRMVTVVGAMTIGPVDPSVAVTGPVAAGSDGFVYWILTAGDADYVSVYAY